MLSDRRADRRTCNTVIWEIYRIFFSSSAFVDVLLYCVQCLITEYNSSCENFVVVITAVLRVLSLSTLGAKCVYGVDTKSTTKD